MLVLDWHGGFLTLNQERNKKFFQDFPGGAVVKDPPANAGDTGSSPGPGRSHMPRRSQALASGARAPQQEKPPQWEACAPQRRVAPARRN